MEELKKLLYNSIYEVREKANRAFDAEYERGNYDESIKSQFAGRAGKSGSRTAKNAESPDYARPAAAEKNATAQEVEQPQEHADKTPNDEPLDTNNDGNQPPESSGGSPDNSLKTLAHSDENLNGREIVAETADGKSVVVNPENKSGVSVVRNQTENQTVESDSNGSKSKTKREKSRADTVQGVQFDEELREIESAGGVAVPANPANTSQKETLTQGAAAPSDTGSAELNCNKLPKRFTLQFLSGSELDT